MAQLLLPAAAMLIGLIIIILVLQDVFEVLLLPRRVARSRRLASMVLRPTWRLWRGAATVFSSRFRPVFLSAYGPLSIVVLYLIWAAFLIEAYGLCEWSSNVHAAHPLSLAAIFTSAARPFSPLALAMLPLIPASPE
jgi:hypothetical protein